ncbi:endothelin-converting enzyme 2-like [Musca vetustissima]|uniref:endothelin-converting enzyme 2-like n=1 Tax=Musca vetustissima TaxID=27455 RepID=UPI002AB7CBF8|nr:endothelin-converting enzyme 2-like [Musca vetustissima]
MKTVVFLLPLITISHGYHQNPTNRLISTIHSYMDVDADPCDNFYQYACGNWERIHQNLTNKYVDTFGSLDYIFNERMKFILHGGRRRGRQRRHRKGNFENIEIYQKVRKYLEICEEQKEFEAEYYLEILKPLPQGLAEWPGMGEKWQGKFWNFWSTLGRLQAVGFNGFPLLLDMKHINSTHFQLELDKVNILGYTAYEQRIVDRLEGSLNPHYRQLAADMDEVLKSLAKLHKQHNSFREEQLSLGELIEKIPHADFQEFFENLFGLERRDFETVPIVVMNLDFFHDLAEMLHRTSPSTLIHLLRIKFLGYMEKLLPKKENNLQCLQHMRDLVPLALDYIYEQEVYRYQRNHTDEIIKGVFNQMQLKFSEILQHHLGEFSEREIEFLQRKIHYMKLNIGNLPQTKRGENFYTEYFRNWHVVDDDFYWNHMNALQHYYRQKYQRLFLKGSTPHHTFFVWPYGSPAFQPSANLIVIPHAYLRFPIFHPGFHPLFLYAELGNTLGHEIMHAFEINGLDYDAYGNPSTLLSSSLGEKREFVKSLRCFAQQKSASLNEKIADISGFNLAYATYFERRHPRQPEGWSTPLSDRQLFFIKFAQFFCAINPRRITYDESHDTPQYRVPQVVANHREFEEVFQCSPGSTKRRVILEKCNLW